MPVWTAPLFCILGFVLLFKRLTPALWLKPFSGQVPSPEGRVSLIIPARNEEAMLPKLLASVQSLPFFEVIVVDDQSTDQTRQCVTEATNVRLIEGISRPDGWTGKNWACHQGATAATGEYFLFTDADTMHDPESLSRALDRIQHEKIDLLSAVPFHRCETWWERLLGPFQLLIFVSSGAFSKPRQGRVFAIGQYLFFRREMYERQGGHERIRASLCDDLDLANECLREGGHYVVEPRRLFQVRMFTTFSEFIKGWKRIIRLGLKHASPWSGPVMFLVIAALTASMRFFAADPVSQILMLSSVALLAVLQRSFGQFSLLGILLWPVSLALFTWVSVLALVDLLMKRRLIWRGRTYGL